MSYLDDTHAPPEGKRHPCDFCGRPNSAVAVLYIEWGRWGLHGCGSCTAYQRREQGVRGLITHPAPVMYPAPDPSAYTPRHVPYRNATGWAPYHDKPVSELTLSEQHWERQYHEDHLDDLEFDRMATE